MKQAGIVGVVLALSLALSLLLVPAQASTTSTRTFTNPVYRHNFPDPYILRVDHTYYAYGTGTCTYNLQVMHSTDLVHWTGDKEALPNPPGWATDDCASFFQNRLIWAPEVLHRSDGKYVLYYVAHSKGLNVACVSYALSDHPDGPFSDTSSGPFVCQPKQGGSIDPDVFRDRNGRLYLLWKNDGNALNMTTYLYSHPMAASGTKLTGKAVRLVSNDQAWEGPLVEAPTMWRRGSSYYLFFSGGAFNTTTYAVGYATCKGPLGPCHVGSGNPILKSPRYSVLTTRCKAAGPGHQTLINDSKGHTWIAYHAWIFPHVGDEPGGIGRVLWIDRVNWKHGKPVVHGPTCSAQPTPS